MFIADTHSDTLFALGVAGTKDTMITAERLHEGGVTLQVFAMFTGGKGNKGDYEGIARAEYAQVPYLPPSWQDPFFSNQGSYCDCR